MTTLNPNGNNWANSDNMGKRLLEKTGWKQGEGIGKNKQGTLVHIKVSIKNEKDGIGFKSEKRESTTSQGSAFDHLLKSKYFKASGEDEIDKAMERGLSRARFGRAVPKDYFKPVTKDAWNKILGENKKHDTSCDNQTEFEIDHVNKSKPAENSSFTSKFTIYEYFITKMKEKTKDFDHNSFYVNKMDSLKLFLKDLNSIEGDKPQKESKKRKERDFDDTDIITNKKIKLTSNADLVEEMTQQPDVESEKKIEKKKSKKNKINEETTKPVEIKVEKQKKSKKDKLKSEKPNKDEEKFDINQKLIDDQSVKGNKKKSKKNKVESEMSIPEENVLEKPNKKENKSIKNTEQVNISSEIETYNKLKKSKENKLEKTETIIPESLNEEPKKKKSKKSKNIEKDDSEGNSESAQKKNKTNISEIIETGFCAWSTSNVHEIQGYKYY